MSFPSVPAAASPSADRRRRIGLLAACAAALSLSACTQTGDFGRKRPNVINDTLLPLAGTASAYARSEPVSLYRMTDSENEMRDLAWGVVMPPLENQWRERVFAELKRTRILPANRFRIDKSFYVKALLSTDFRSSRARYDRLIEDVVADTHRIEPFFAMASNVDRDDRVREKALAVVPEVTLRERENALARIEENGMMIAWVRVSFEERLLAYRYALDRLVLETPDRASVEAEAAIRAFEAVLASLQPLGPKSGVFKG